MENNKRPETMERITTPALAEAFIEEQVAAIRSQMNANLIYVDAMTATVEDVPFALLQHITDQITHEVEGVNRVLYDLTPKPVGTIKWE